MHGEGRESFPILFCAGQKRPGIESRQDQDIAMSDIETLTGQALADVAAAQDPERLEALRVALLGKSGSITAQLKQLGSLPADQRKQAGEAINIARDAVSTARACDMLFSTIALPLAGFWARR